MTDREPTAPANQPTPARKPQPAFPPGEQNLNAHPESAPRGDSLPMSVTLAPHRHSRHDTKNRLTADQVRTWLDQLPSTLDELPAFAPAVRNTDIDCQAAEADAVSRAAQCPDLFVIHAPDIAVGERIIADLARTVASPSARVLILSPNPVAVDRITEQLAQFAQPDQPWVLRSLAEGENPARRSPVVSRLTTSVLSVERVEQAKRAADAAIVAADAQLTVIESLAESAEKLAKVESEIAELTVRRDAIAAVVRTETDTPFTARLAALRVTQDQAVAQMFADIDALATTRTETEAEIAKLREQHAEAAADTTKKPGFFGRLLGKGRHTPEPAEIEQHIHEREAELTRIDTRRAELERDIETAADKQAAERERFICDEIAARQAETDPELASLTERRQRIMAEMESEARKLGAPTPAPDELPGLRYEVTRVLVEAKEHAAEVHRIANEDGRRFLDDIPIVIGTPGSLGVDPVFARDSQSDNESRDEATFDLLILDRAEELPEVEFVRLANLACRWVLVGDAPPVDEPHLHRNGPPQRHASRNGRPVPPGFASRMARFLDRETWAIVGDRLVCRLIETHPELRPGMTCEPLLDCPEIELRFIEDADGEPEVAEVAFPMGTAVVEAKAFLFQQLERVLLRPCGPLYWHHHTTAITACWPLVDRGTDAVWVELEPGVREKVVGSGLVTFTATVEFDPNQGWTADSAAEWLEAQLPSVSASRFAVVV